MKISGSLLEIKFYLTDLSSHLVNCAPHFLKFYILYLDFLAKVSFGIFSFFFDLLNLLVQLIYFAQVRYCCCFILQNTRLLFVEVFYFLTEQLVIRN